MEIAQEENADVDHGHLDVAEPRVQVEVDNPQYQGGGQQQAGKDQDSAHFFSKEARASGRAVVAAGEPAQGVSRDHQWYADGQHRPQAGSDVAELERPAA